MIQIPRSTRICDADYILVRSPSFSSHFATAVLPSGPGPGERLREHAGLARSDRCSLGSSGCHSCGCGR